MWYRPNLGERKKNVRIAGQNSQKSQRKSAKGLYLNVFCKKLIILLEPNTSIKEVTTPDATIAS